jgi:glucosamine--fructose-6-phosphate aminotransferase (isomerizing)
MRNEERYTKFALIREMMESVGIVREFKLEDAEEVSAAIQKAGKLFLTGEGSSRIFPAKNARTAAMRWGSKLTLATEGGRQAAEYGLHDFVVYGASNSGRTKEVVLLFEKLRREGHGRLFGLTANMDTPLEALSNQCFILSCGKEDAVAATKSVIEQALFYHTLVARLEGREAECDLDKLAEAIEEALTMTIPAEWVSAIAQAGTIYFAGRNDGVAEEITLKTNEIARRKSDYLEGTYLVHGVEEVMDPEDVVILMSPFEDELEKIQETLADGVGMKVFAIHNKDTIFPTLKITDLGSFTSYVCLAAGWNLLVEVGLALGINLDKPVRARKIGNILDEPAG